MDDGSGWWYYSDEGEESGDAGEESEKPTVHAGSSRDHGRPEEQPEPPAPPAPPAPPKGCNVELEILLNDVTRMDRQPPLPPPKTPLEQFWRDMTRGA
jgi:hypothetical protein